MSKANLLEMLSGKKSIHLIGIGGAGMSGIAQLLLELGYVVSGSDIKPSPITKRIEKKKGKVFIGHNQSNVKNAELVIYSSAISDQNPEMVAAKQKGIPVVPRARILGELMRDKIGIAITGTHGKTTTTALISHMLLTAKMNPTVAIGGEMPQLGGNAKLGQGCYFVAEADESDASFLWLSPTYSVVTNIDRDHLDHYHDLGEIVESFRQFMNKTKTEGCLFCSEDDEKIKEILATLRRRFVTFGLSKDGQYHPANIEMEENRSQFDCISKGKKLGRIYLPLPGLHNVSNALAAIALGDELGIGFEVIQDALASYKGVERRFQMKLNSEMLVVIDDYAHHPTEIKTTLEALRNWKDRRIVCVFQPHRYSRTKYLKDDFAQCFSSADHLVMTDIYSANEEPLEGVYGKNIYEEIIKTGQRDVCFLAKDKITEHLFTILRPRDIVIVMGAGDIGFLADRLVEKFERAVADERPSSLTRAAE